MRNYIQVITFGLSVLALRTLREKEYWRKQTGKHITIAMLGVVVMLGVSDVTLAVPIPFSNTIDFAANGTQTVGSDTRTVTTVSDNAPFIFTHSVTFSPPALSIVSATLALTHTHVSINGELWSISGGTSTFLGFLSESNGAWITDTFTIPATLYPSFVAGSWSLAVKLTESTSGNDTFDLDKSELRGTYLPNSVATIAAVPEPATVLLLGIGLTVFSIFALYRSEKI